MELEKIKKIELENGEAIVTELLKEAKRYNGKIEFMRLKRRKAG